ncbi:hypothetical protein M8494_15770 [Serratia ureilytica]
MVEQASCVFCRRNAQRRSAAGAHAENDEPQRTARQTVDDALAERDMALGAVRETQAKIAQKAIRAPFSGVAGIRRA